MADVGQGTKLALEAKERSRVQVRHGLERDRLAALDVSGPVNGPHPSFAEAPLDDEAPGAVKSDDRPDHVPHVGPTLGSGPAIEKRYQSLWGVGRSREAPGRSDQ